MSVFKFEIQPSVFQTRGTFPRVAGYSEKSNVQLTATRP